MDETTSLLVERDGPLSTTVTARDDIVEFDPNGDPDNPMDWPRAYKWSIVALLAFTSFTVTFTCISIVPVATEIVRDLDHGSSQDRKFASVLMVTIWELGEAAGPLLIAPLSEVFGRSPVINIANLLFILATILAALSQNTALLISARALTGLTVASNVLNPAIVGDMFISQERGSAMSLIMLAPLLGGAVGPAIAGAMAQSVGWRYVLWFSAALASAAELAFLMFFRETYKVRILRKRAKRLRTESGKASARTEFDDDNPGKSSSEKLWATVMRPAVVLLDSGVLQALSLYGSVVFSWFYIMATTLPDILEDIYGLSPTMTGTAFMSFSVGSTLGVIICNSALDRIYIRLRDANGGVEQPEHRLPLAVVGGVLLPITTVAYGWTAHLHLPIPFLLLSVGLMGATMLLAFLPLMAFVVDSFGLYSASALTALIVTRCLTGTFLPLTTGPLIKIMGYGWAFTMLGGATLALAPIPALVYRYGVKWRKASAYAMVE